MGALLLLLSARTAAPPGGLLIADGGLGGVLEIRAHDVRVVINNGIAVTEVDQVFRNTEDRLVEALYTFPVPKNASVSSFSMWIDGKEMVGEVVEKQRAREIYESYKRRNIDPGLLEQTDYKTFEMRIFPIPPGAEQRVRVAYYQELDVDDDWATYVYPLATSTRSGVDSRVHGRFSLSIETRSEVPVVEMESPSHPDDFLFVEHSPGYHQASLEAAGGSLARDVVVAYRLERAQTGLDLVTSRLRGEDGYFQLTLTAGKELEELSEGMDYVFVGDVSGSMRRDAKLDLSHKAIASFLDALGATDRFEVVTFSVTPEAVHGRLRAVGEEALGEALAFLADRDARGGTRLRPAVETAYRYLDPDRTLNVVVLSDGMTEQQELDSLLQLIRERPAGVRVFCIGIGNEVNRPLLRQMAEGAGGLAAFVSHGDDFDRQARAFRRKLMRPAMTDVRLAIEGGEVYDVEPAELPDLFHGSPVRVYGRYAKSGPVEIRLAANLVGRPTEQRFAVDFPKVDEANPELERMWAWHRVQALLDEGRARGESEGLRADVVELCETYSIVSEHASFLVLENDAEYRRWKIDRRNAARIERDRTAQASLRDELAELRSRTAEALGPVAPNEPVAERSPARHDAPVSSRPSGRVPAQRFVPTSSPGSRGGGAIDPVTGTLAIGIAAAAWAARRRRREGDGEGAA